MIGVRVCVPLRAHAGRAFIRAGVRICVCVCVCVCVLYMGGTINGWGSIFGSELERK